MIGSTLSTKRLSLMKASVTEIRRVAMLWNKTDLGMCCVTRRRRGLRARSGSRFTARFSRGPTTSTGRSQPWTRDPPDAILLVPTRSPRSTASASSITPPPHRVPAIYEYDPLVQDGGLMSYGARSRESFERAAALIARIFGGARPAVLPVEQPNALQTRRQPQDREGHGHRVAAWALWRWPTR